MESRLILEALCESLSSSDEREAEVAREFLADILVRKKESLANRFTAAFHLARYLTRKTAMRSFARAVRRPEPAVDPQPVADARPRITQLRFDLDEPPRPNRAARAVNLLAGTVRHAAASTARGTLRFVRATLRRARSVPTRVASVAVAGVVLTKTGAAGLARLLADLVIDGYRAAVAGARDLAVSMANRITALFVSAALSLARAALRALDVAVYSCHAVVVGYRATRAAGRRLVLSVVSSIVGALRAAARRIHRIWTAVAEAFLRTIDAIVRTYRALHRLARMELLPETSARTIVASVVFVVLVVFGMNWYSIVRDVNKKGIFVDETRYEWGDEALASMMMGEAYDIYLKEKITEKKIKELLATGRHYERTIHVTGYYSPLPDQGKYATGSYWGDIKLNGRGIMGADTTPVHLGMAAGPPHMKYGTNIIITDLGKFDLPKVYTVHDRGSAIVGNRLDIWVGKGEEAMKKAYEITGNYRVIIVEK